MNRAWHVAAVSFIRACVSGRWRKVPYMAVQTVEDSKRGALQRFTRTGGVQILQHAFYSIHAGPTNVNGADVQ